MLSVVITVGILIALIEPVLEFFGEVPFGDFFTTEGQFAVIPLVTATLMVTLDRAAGGGPDRAGCGDVPLRVRLAAGAQDPQAHGRAARRRAVGGLRVLRAVLRHALAAAGPARDRGRLHQRAGRRPDPRRDDRSRRSPRSPRTRCRPSRRRCGRARWPWVPTGCRPRCAWCCPRPSRASAAAIVLGMSRAVGETMIVALAAGAQKNMTVDVREGAQTMTGFIAQTAGGENPVGSRRVQHAVRGRAAAVPDHPASST